MARSRRIIIVGLVLFILLIIGLVAIFKGNKQSKATYNNNQNPGKLSNMYQKIQENQNFTFSMEEDSDEVQYKVSMAQKGSDISIDMYSDNEHTTTLVLNNQAYYIMHEEEEYYDFGSEEVDADIVISGLDEITKKQYITGEEKIKGKQYYYEEYDNESANFIIFADTNEISNIKTRFYFDGDNIVYIKNIVTDEDGEHEEIIKSKLTFEADEKLFKIPDNYAEVED